MPRRTLVESLAESLRDAGPLQGDLVYLIRRARARQDLQRDVGCLIDDDLTPPVQYDDYRSYARARAAKVDEVWHSTQVKIEVLLEAGTTWR